MSRTTLRLLCALCLVLAGCAKAGEKLLPVEGKVMLGDKPLPSGWVTLHPDADKGNKSQEEPRGEITADGTFKVYTGRREGAAPGPYKVAVSAADQVDLNNPYFTKWLAPEVYADWRTSKLVLDVVANPAPGAYDFKLDPKRK
jgi:hypothetical protein